MAPACEPAESAAQFGSERWPRESEVVEVAECRVEQLPVDEQTLGDERAIRPWAHDADALRIDHAPHLELGRQLGHQARTEPGLSPHDLNAVDVELQTSTTGFAQGDLDPQRVGPFGDYDNILLRSTRSHALDASLNLTNFLIKIVNFSVFSDQLRSLLWGGVTPSQCKGARRLLGLSVDDLAHRAGVATGTVRSFETGGVRTHTSRVDRIKATLVDLGIVFREAVKPGHAPREQRIVFDDGSSVELTR